jgi:hypothetical protein
MQRILLALTLAITGCAASSRRHSEVELAGELAARHLKRRSWWRRNPISLVITPDADLVDETQDGGGRVERHVRKLAREA